MPDTRSPEIGDSRDRPPIGGHAVRIVETCRVLDSRFSTTSSRFCSRTVRSPPIVNSLPPLGWIAKARSYGNRYSERACLRETAVDGQSPHDLMRHRVQQAEQQSVHRTSGRSGVGARRVPARDVAVFGIEVERRTIVDTRRFRGVSSLGRDADWRSSQRVTLS